MKFFRFLLISFLVFLLPFLKASACQFDTSVNNYIVKGNVVYASSYFHPFQLEYLLNEKGVTINEIKELFLHGELIYKYLSDNIVFRNGLDICSVKNFSFVETDDVSIYFDGVGVRYNIICDGVIKNGDIKISFFEEVRKQTNILALYFGDTSNEINREYLFPMEQTMLFSIDNKYLLLNDDFNDIEIDNTEIHDNYLNETEDYKEENIYDNPYESDNLGLKLSLEDCNSCSIEADHNVDENDFYYSFLIDKDVDFFDNSNSGLIGDGFVNNLYKKLVGYLANYLRNDDKSIVILFLIIMSMGFLHAAGPGHTKSILASIMIDEGKKFKDGLVFITSFTLAHYLDIIILSLILNILVFHIDITLYVSILQKIAVFVLFLISLYLLRKSIKGLIGGNKNIKTDSCSCCSHHNHNHKKSNKTNILLGLSSGIVPCMLGWSILLILTSLGMLQYVFLMIIALAFGTFLFLLVFLLLIGYLKKVSYSKISKFLEYTPIFSAILLLIISLSLLFGIIDFN